MTLQNYNKIKLLYNGLLSVQLDYIENYKAGNIYRLGEFKGIIRKVKLCPDYGLLGTTFLILELL